MTRTIPPALAVTVVAWSEGIRTSPELARHLGIGLSAAQARLGRCRRAGLVGPAPRVHGTPPVPLPRLGTVTLGGLTAGAWRYLDATTTVTFRGRAVAEWRPLDAPPPPSTDHLILPDIQPEPSTALELARLGMQAAQALAEVEEIRDLLHPGQRLITSKREQEAVRRRRRYVQMKHEGDTQ